jgi:hypothetical protein
MDEPETLEEALAMLGHERNSREEDAMAFEASFNGLKELIKSQEDEAVRLRQELEEKVAIVGNSPCTAFSSSPEMV